MLKPVVIPILLSGLLAALMSAPERTVAGSVITSDHEPQARIRLPASVQYAGADRWDLYGIADCELHAFVEADSGKNIRRLYWVQFEGYLPAKPELTYQYDSPRHATLGGVDFYLDTWVRPANAPSRSGSDREHIEALLRARGYKMPPGMMYVRLVHLLDEHKRRELMIVYGEDLAPTGLIAAELAEGGKAHDQWPAIEKGLVERAEQTIHLEGPAKP